MRRRPIAGYAVVLLGLIGIGGTYAALTAHGSPASAAGNAANPQQIAQGRTLFVQNCSSCHGLMAQGTATGPSLIGVGGAAVYFQVSTGRMPAKELEAEMARKPPVFNDQQTRAIAAYIQALGGGPPIPSAGPGEHGRALTPAWARNCSPRTARSATTSWALAGR